jgi:hypothetical protein
MSCQSADRDKFAWLEKSSVCLRIRHLGLWRQPLYTWVPGLLAVGRATKGGARMLAVFSSIPLRCPIADSNDVQYELRLVNVHGVINLSGIK